MAVLATILSPDLDIFAGVTPTAGEQAPRWHLDGQVDNYLAGVDGMQIRSGVFPNILFTSRRSTLRWCHV